MTYEKTWKNLQNTIIYKGRRIPIYDESSVLTKIAGLLVGITLILWICLLVT